MTSPPAAASAAIPKQSSDMSAPRYIPLQWKFIGIATAATIVFTAIFGNLTAFRNRNILSEATEKQGKVLAQTVAAMIINELIYEKLGLVEEGGLIDNYLRELYKRRELDYLYLAVLDEKGQVISHSDFREYGNVYQDDFFDFSGDPHVKVRNIDTGQGEKALEFAASLSIGGKNWGAFLFAVSLKNVTREIQAMLIEIWAVAAFALCIGLILILFLSKRFIKPITNLASVIRNVDVKMPQPQQAQITGNDEMAQLADDFNAMLNRLIVANDEMKMAHEKLLQSEKLATLGILSSSVAHRINNPLGGLQNCIAMLRRNGDDSEFRTDYLDLMQEGVGSIEQTVSQLLWSAGKRRGEEAEADVASVLSAVLRLIDYRIKKKAIYFSSDVPANLLLAVSPHDLNQILVNLLVNAVQAMPEGGRLTIVARKRESEITISVTDTGAGISGEALDKIFDMFYTTKDPEEGTGLGLWMTYELVQRNKGDIKVESSPGMGTTFAVTFPEAS